MGTGQTDGKRQETTEESQEISDDECFHMLSNHRRRYTLHYLNQNGEETTIGELSDQIAAWENGTETDSITHEERKRVYTSLQQVHLPRMDEEDVIEFDDRAGVVEKGPAAEDLDIYLEVVRDDEVPWNYLYLGLAALNAALVGTASTGLLEILEGTGLAVFAVATFCIISIAHLYYSKSKMKLGESDRPPTAENSQGKNGG